MRFASLCLNNFPECLQTRGPTFVLCLTLPCLASPWRPEQRSSLQSILQKAESFVLYEAHRKNIPEHGYCRFARGQAECREFPGPWSLVPWSFCKQRGERCPRRNQPCSERSSNVSWWIGMHWGKHRLTSSTSGVRRFP